MDHRRLLQRGFSSLGTLQLTLGLTIGVIASYTLFTPTTFLPTFWPTERTSARLANLGKIKMNVTYECEKARHLFGEFLRRLEVCTPTCLGPNELDAPVESLIAVGRVYATNCFLRKNPSYEQFRGDLSKVRQGIDRFTFKVELWASMTPQC
jgi:hypothetical protein